MGFVCAKSLHCLIADRVKMQQPAIISDAAPLDLHNELLKEDTSFGWRAASSSEWDPWMICCWTSICSSKCSFLQNRTCGFESFDSSNDTLFSPEIRKTWTLKKKKKVFFLFAIGLGVLGWPKMGCTPNACPLKSHSKCLPFSSAIKWRDKKRF